MGEFRGSAQNSAFHRKLVHHLVVVTYFSSYSHRHHLHELVIDVTVMIRTSAIVFQCFINKYSNTDSIVLISHYQHRLKYKLNSSSTKCQNHRGVENVKGVPLPSPLGVWRRVISSPAGSGAELQPRTHLGEFLAAKTLLAASVFTFFCMEYVR